MSDLYFGTDLFSELDRLQRQMSSLLGGFPSSLRSSRLGTFPQINIVDKGLLTIAGERKTSLPDSAGSGRAYAQERFVGAFRRAVELPQHADPDKVQARYIDGCLLISIGKREASRPRAITVE